MNKRIELLDCTLRDGAYITESNFGTPAIKGIIKKLQEANVEIIECGWLKNNPHKLGTSYYHVPSDLEKYLIEKKIGVTYSVMIDWDRYDLNYLPKCNHKSLNAIRVVFPHGKHEGGCAVASSIKEKGYDVYLQAANTLAYSNEDLIKLAKCVNKLNPIALSIVDTFGAMYEEDLDRIMYVLDKELKPNIKLGLHTHNNQQLAFSLTCHFIKKMMTESKRSIIIDSSLSGMGRGAGNATSELVISYLNRKWNTNYDLDPIMDAIDTYIDGFKVNYTWGYSTPYFIAGNYCCHVNNIAYLLKNHRTNSKDMRNIIESMGEKERKAYDYDYLENKYISNQSKIVDDSKNIENLTKLFKNKKILLIAPGKTIDTHEKSIKAFIKKEKPITIAVNAINDKYKTDYAFFTNTIRYDYAKTSYKSNFLNIKKILLSNIKQKNNSKEIVVNYNRTIKRGWEHFDNAVICCLRLLNKLSVKDIYIAGFDGFKNKYNDSYSDTSLPTLNPSNKWEELNKEIKDMYLDVKKTTKGEMSIKYITPSIFDI